MASSAAEQHHLQQQQNQHEQQHQQQKTTLEFYQAMADFKNMFPQMDNDVIEAVLRSNQGAVDTTIDQLLSMSTDNENEKIRSEIEKQEDEPKFPILPKIYNPAISKSVQKWQPYLIGPLPHSFLRITREGSCTNNSDFNTVLDTTLLEDERIAFFLQNEEFMAELRWNKDFMSTLENDSKLHSKSDSATDEDLFRERIRNMGKASRKKFSQLTKVFTRGKKRDRGQLLPPAVSSDDLLDHEEIQRPHI